MNDQQASVVVEAVLELAIAVRDDGPVQIELALDRVSDAAGGDLRGALVVAAALIRVDLPVDAWWQRGLDGLGADGDGSERQLAPCGTHAAFVRHQARGEQIDQACVMAERVWHREYMAARRRVARAAEAEAVAS